MVNFYNSIKSANEVLEYYENFLLRCEHIIYIAVVKNKSKTQAKEGYSIEIAIPFSKKDIVKIDEKQELSPLEIYLGIFGKFTIPTSFPIPSDFQYKLRNSSNFRSLLKDFLNNDREKLQEINNLKNVVSKIGNFRHIDTSVVFVNEKDEGKVVIEKVKEEKHIGARIFNIKKTKKLTLGATFELIEFPKMHFGITNQHLFDYPGAKLGDKVFDSQGNEIGELFWMVHDIYRDVSLIKMSHKIKTKNNFIISEPQIDMKVTHNGFNSHREDASEGVIISTNATVRIYDQNDPEKWRLYKKQLLITENTKGGDSGSLVINDKNKIVGLNFGRTFGRKVVLGEKEERSLSVANNINLILNHKYYQKQEIFLKKYTTHVATSLTNEFRIENFLI